MDPFYVVNKRQILASIFQVTHETAANNRNTLNKDDGVNAPEPPGEQVQHSHRADYSSEEKTEEKEKKEAKEEENNEKRDERASSDSSSSSEDEEPCSRLEDATIGFLTIL